MATWLQAASVSVAANSLVINITGSVDMSPIRQGDAVLIGGQIWECASGNRSDASGNSQINLAKPWPYAAVSNKPAQVFRTTHDLLRLTSDARKLTDVTKSLLINQEEVLISELEKLEIGVGVDPLTGLEEKIQVTPWQYIINQTQKPVGGTIDLLASAEAAIRSDTATIKNAHWNMQLSEKIRSAK